MMCRGSKIREPSNWRFNFHEREMCAQGQRAGLPKQKQKGKSNSSSLWAMRKISPSVRRAACLEPFSRPVSIQAALLNGFGISMRVSVGRIWSALICFVHISNIQPVPGIQTVTDAHEIWHGSFTKFECRLQHFESMPVRGIHCSNHTVGSCICRRLVNELVDIVYRCCCISSVLICAIGIT